MKKLLVFLLSFTVILAACGNQQSKDGKLKVYTTVYPLKSFVQQIGGKYVDVKTIYPNGADIHSYEPTQKEVLDIAKGDLFVYTSDALDPIGAKIAKTINDNEKTLPAAKGIDEKSLLAPDHDEDEHEHGHAEASKDPHVWLDPVMDKEFAKAIKNYLVKQDSAHKDYYEKNYAALAKDIDDIDQKMKKITTHPKHDTVYISHDSLGYLAKRYHFKQEGVSGMNNDEPSQQQIVTMINDIKSKKAEYILYEQNISSKITDIIKDRTNTKAVKFHNMSVLTDKDAQDKTMTYQKLMEQNIKSLDKALNQ